MHTMKEVLEAKGGQVHAIGGDASVLEAATRMNEHKVGALMVLDGEKTLGLLSERDILRKVLAERRDPAEVKVEEVMTRKLACARPGTTVDEARLVMMREHVRHLPIVDEEERILGVVSIGDLNAWQLNGQEKTITYLNEYIHGYR